MTSKNLRGRATLGRWERTQQSRLDALTVAKLCKDILDHLKNIVLAAVLILGGRIVEGNPIYRDFSVLLIGSGIAVLLLNVAILVAWFFRSFPLKFWGALRYSRYKKARDPFKLIVVFFSLWVIYGFFVVKMVELLVVTKLA